MNAADGVASSSGIAITLGEASRENGENTSSVRGTRRSLDGLTRRSAPRVGYVRVTNPQATAEGYRDDSVATHTFAEITENGTLHRTSRPLQRASLQRASMAAPASSHPYANNPLVRASVSLQRPSIQGMPRRGSST